MNIYDYAETLLMGTSLEDKLLAPVNIDITHNNTPYDMPLYPGRDESIAFSDEQVRFPGKGKLHLPEKRALAMHFFANHELLAIEMMAAAILKFPGESEEDLKLKKGLLKTIADEQKHFKLYVNRMKDFGLNFGDVPLNDFFWRQMPKIDNPSQFFSVMALTFEQANLDFADFYRHIFAEYGDEKSARIMDIVFEDEISHVAFGRTWLNTWKQSKSLWDYYLENLPDNLTPARAKGIVLNIEARQRAGLDDHYIDSIENYRDNFKLTNRKSWKSEN
ncbi:DUF455 family protein [Halobacteriovorax sp. GB3]|uniref:DUF455 family protein n=1 Tax=Halobacteriovorax sp. GB3 TaxID=2719615 RepID=UPI0023629A5B|nr:DUF455 family protein [Halobacteriovorax sp. GB3]MDD0854211.1 DUF455 family protein [Halobacteriovorax sp. GB3]